MTKLMKQENIQVATQSANLSPFDALKAQLTERRDEFRAILPPHCTLDRFYGILITAVIKNNELLNADRASFFLAARFAAQDGLLPDGRDAAFVIYSTKQKDGTYKPAVQYMPMIAGIFKKMRNTGELSTISAHVVYENDEFDYCLGDEEYIKHKPQMANRGKPICAYAIAKTKDGAIYREVMGVADIETIRSKSKSKAFGPWVDFWDEMARKTIIRRLSKRLPMSVELEQVIQRDDALYQFDNTTTIKHSQLENLNRKIAQAKESPVHLLADNTEDDIETRQIPNDLLEDIEWAKQERENNQ